MGPYEIQFEDALKDIGAKQQKYHGGAMIGKHCSEVLKQKNAIILLSPLRSSPNHQKLLDLFELLDQIFKLCNKKTKLTA